MAFQLKLKLQKNGKDNLLVIVIWMISLNVLVKKKMEKTDGDRYIFVKPIPLDEDMLKVNGFEFSAETGVIRYVYLTPKDTVFVEPRKEKSRLGKNWFWFENGRRDLDVIRPKCFIPFVYVHQLQHALRLCGLQELADNFIL